MPYRRLPKTDASRLQALRALTDSNASYTVEARFLDRSMIAEARQLCERLSQALEQYQLCMRTQVRYARRIAGLQHQAMMYLSHFLQVLFLAIERGEISRDVLPMYGLEPGATAVPYLKTSEAVMEWAPKVINGEKSRVKKGGKPVLTPPIGAVVTHFDVFKGMYDSQRQYQMRTKAALADISSLRTRIDEVILSLWNQIEQHYENEPPETRYAQCRRYGIVYYYRRHEPHIY